MFQWWNSLESLSAINSWVQLLALIGAAVTAFFVFQLWSNGNRMVNYVIDRERHANKRIKAIEKAAEQIRKELLATQQNQDIADQKRRLAEMDADTLRKELEKIRKRYSDAEGALKSQIDALKDINITQTTETETETEPEPEKSGFSLNPEQLKTLNNMLKSGPKGELDIIAILDDGDSNNLALEIKKAFDEQGWTTQGIIQSAFSNPPAGITLVIHSKQTAPSYSKFLQRTLTTIGLPVTAQINTKFREWSISMIVGQIR